MSLLTPAIPSTDALLRVLVESTASVTGHAFFDALTRALAESLRAAHVALSRPSPTAPGHIETVSAFAGGVHTPGIAYAMEHTPCKHVVGGKYAHHPDDVVSLFPEDQFFVDTGTRSYIGVPISTPDERSLGLITLCFDHPTHHLVG